MNVERLLEFVDEIAKIESRNGIQGKLQKLHASIQAIMSNPQDGSQQTGARARLTELRNSLQNADDELTPAARRFLDETSDLWAFTPSLADELETIMNANAMTPAVANEETQKKVNGRQNIVVNLQKAGEALRLLGFDIETLEPGEAQLGFTIPRDLFENTLGGLATELRLLDRVVGVFSEAITGEREHPSISQLSTSDPLIFIATHAPVVLAIGASIKFFISQWKDVENIRHVREQTKALKIANDAALKSFDDHLTEKINAAIETKITELLPHAVDGRGKELENGLRWALKHLMSRIERGMTVEIKFIPPPKIETPKDGEGEGDREQTQADQVFDKLADVRQELMFNRITKGQPLLELEPPPPVVDEPEKGVRPRRKKKPKSSQSG